MHPSHMSEKKVRSTTSQASNGVKNGVIRRQTASKTASDGAKGGVKCRYAAPGSSLIERKSHPYVTRDNDSKRNGSHAPIRDHRSRRGGLLEVKSSHGSLGDHCQSTIGGAFHLRRFSIADRPFSPPPLSSGRNAPTALPSEYCRRLSRRHLDNTPDCIRSTSVDILTTISESRQHSQCYSQ